MLDISFDGKPRHASRASLKLTGVERILASSHWDYLSKVAPDRFPADSVNGFYCDAIEKLVLQQPEAAIMNLSLSLEAAESEARKNAKIKDYGVPINNLNRNPQALKYADKRVLKDLFVARGHIAHAKSAPAKMISDTSLQSFFTEATKVLMMREHISRGGRQDDLIVAHEDSFITDGIEASDFRW